MYDTYLAVEKVLAQTLADAADAAIVAMINILLAIIVPELADTAVVLRGLFTTRFAPLRGRLSMPAQHAEHVLRFLPNKMMILDFIVAEPAGVPFLASITLQLHISLVVFAA